MAESSGSSKFAGSLNSAMIDGPEAQAALEYAMRFGEPGFEDVERIFITQHYEGYSAENQEAWTTLFDRQMEFLESRASKTYLQGARSIRLSRDRIPHLHGPESINHHLMRLTGWKSRGVPGLAPAKAFFAALAQREFATTIVMRPKESLNYLPEPDIFHDVFGHVPLHADAVFGEFLQTYGKAASLTSNPEHIKRMGTLFWFTVEFGLIREDGNLKLYGSGLLSSPAESRHALESNEVERRPFDLEAACTTPYEIDHFQPILYVLDSFDQLRDAMNRYAERILNENATLRGKVA